MDRGINYNENNKKINYVIKGKVFFTLFYFPLSFKIFFLEPPGTVGFRFDPEKNTSKKEDTNLNRI